MRGYVSPQDAGRSRTQTAGTEFPPFSTRDLDGTRSDRLQSIARVMWELAGRFGALGESEISQQCQRNARHFETVAAIHRGENPPMDFFDSNVRSGSSVKVRA